jgi:predicted transcriptional regulator
MNYPRSEVCSAISVLGISEADLAVISGVRLPVLRAWLDGEIEPCDNTVRAVLRALQTARVLRRRNGFVRLDDDAIRFAREQLAAVGALAR